MAHLKIIDNLLVGEAKLFVTALIGSNLSENFLFHTTFHTLDVLKNSEIIGKYSQLSEDELNFLRICALFHDVGYINAYKGHEAESATISGEFLKSKMVEKKLIQRVKNVILSTKVPQQPFDKISRILCDADLMHLTYDSYFEYMDLLRHEWNLCGIVNLNEREFHENSVVFFNSHSYHTVYGRKILKPLKEKTLLRIIERLK
ncbi:MAG: HD domain-containing protein [Bacteroidota bacterium]|nr:hypothetical protein [Odoribacter sp.]MDP3642277.1 HD domain-containing protein [Bacteroidota bacterium]